LATTLVMVGE
jgi:hypothetical protein